MKRIIILGVFVILCSAGAYYYFANKSDNDASAQETEFVNNFVRLISLGNSKDTYNMLTQSLKLTIEEKTWSENIAQSYSKYPSKCSSISMSQIKDDTGTYDGATAKRVKCELLYDNNPYLLNLVIINKDSKILIDDTVIYKK